ncbi:methyltransferase domain-containing protein [Streptomyces sp. NPDC005963]|uniref:methyltransferase domain-containing protein n=1 Tax=Streptomyces sp. NPDC005963 TaxID=3156721 RepID=UPI0033F52348
MTPEWAGAFDAVDRALFLPDVMWPFDMATQTGSTCDRTVDASPWYAAADADVPITTQWDDGHHTGTDPGRVPTSSASMPSVVMAMLAELDVHDGHRVLEIGTGTGWNAALLAHRLGDTLVTTVEIDDAVAVAARSALARSGLHPTVITGDGLRGHPSGAPYDRIIATAGLRTVPYRWVEQTRPGGLIVTPWGTHFSNADHIVRLTVSRDGTTAVGLLGDPVEFMKVRTQRRRVDQAAYLPAEFPGDATIRTTTLTSRSTGLDDPSRHPFMTAARLLVPECAYLGDRRGASRSAWLYGLTDRSWAAAVLHDGKPISTVYQSGPRLLWDELEAAHRWWTGAGEPTPGRFGLTVDSRGEHIWLDTPDHHVLPLDR